MGRISSREARTQVRWLNIHIAETKQTEMEKITGMTWDKQRLNESGNKDLVFFFCNSIPRLYETPPIYIPNSCISSPTKSIRLGGRDWIASWTSQMDKLRFRDQKRTIQKSHVAGRANGGTGLDTVVFGDVPPLQKNISADL